MTGGEAVNVWGSALALVGCLVFVAVYSLFARWWRDRVGRLLVIKALAIAAFMAISICLTVYRPDAEFLRFLRGILAALFGVLMTYQAWLVGHTQIKGARRGAPEDT
jgi:amino acid transporter